MKNQFKVILVIILTIEMGCKKENEYPEPTKEGKNTFGMYVNGKKWVPSVQNLLGPSTFSCLYFKENGNITIYAQNKELDQLFIFSAYEVRKNGNYSLSFIKRFPFQENQNPFDSSRFQVDNKYLNSFFLIDSTKSMLEITKIDTLYNIISGNFSALFYSKKGEKLEITKGIFDAKFN